jgi:hypothetical protein
MNFKILKNEEDGNFVLIIRDGTSCTNKGIYLSFDELCCIDMIVEKRLSEVVNSGIVLRDNFIFPDYDKFKIREDFLYNNNHLLLFYSSNNENTGFSLNLRELFALQCLVKEYILMESNN